MLKIGDRVIKVAVDTTGDFHDIGSKGIVEVVMPLPKKIVINGRSTKGGYLVKWESGYTTFVSDWKVEADKNAMQ